VRTCWKGEADAKHAIAATGQRMGEGIPVIEIPGHRYFAERGGLPAVGRNENSTP